MTFEQFEKLARPGAVVPVYRELLADLETPVSVFRKLDAVGSFGFLLESVEGGEKVGRYSFLGVDPAIVFRVRGNQQEVLSATDSFPVSATPIETLRTILSRYTPVPHPKLPPFIGGAVGYMSYDTVRYYERIPDANPEDVGLPDCLIMVVEDFISFDHVKHTMMLVTNARVEGTDLRAIYDAAVARLDRLRERVRSTRPPAARRPAPSSAAGTAPPTFPVNGVFGNLPLTVTSNCAREDFEAAVRKAKEYITAGDIFQVVLSQRFGARITCSPFDVYRALRIINPSPYMFYLKCGEEFQLAGSSPEILARLQDGTVTVRPIAGTRPRGATPEEDLRLEKDLLADAKERAEHVMLVDLGRNDVGRVSQFGSVRVPPADFMTIERYSHVMHIVSNVTGKLADNSDALDVLGATFPAGTLTGAPKIRAMQIIDELESSRRGPYGGAVVYLGFNGQMDSCITIRTAVIKGDRVLVQAGAGIVADSTPEGEYMETVNKARGMLHAVAMAEGGLD